MNNLDQQYKALLQDILDDGVDKQGRNGITKSIFGRQIRHRMSDGFPLLTTKKMAWKSIVVELLWFLQGRTDLKYLIDNGCNIWNGDSYRAYVARWHKNFEDCGVTPTEDQKPMSMEEFVAFIRTNSADMVDKLGLGDLGPIYGKQWRRWQGYTKQGWSLWFDQMQQVLTQLKTDPDSRRMMVSAWNVGELRQMVLPPCHYGFQVYTRELSGEERSAIYSKRCGFDEANHGNIGGIFDAADIPKRAISLMWNQRSVDVPLGLPFNIASYGLLLMLLGKEVNMVPDQLIGNLGDCHIYNNQIDGIKEQLTRDPYDLPTVDLDFKYSYFDGYLVEWDKIPIDKVKLVGYQSHPTIKMPLSN